MGQESYQAEYVATMVLVDPWRMEVFIVFVILVLEDKDVK